MEKNISDSWLGGNPYERFMGRWSTLAGQEFLNWLDSPPACRWLDVGCGPGILTRLILEAHRPGAILGIDSSPEFVSHARRAIANPLVQFQVGLAQSLDLASNSYDIVVSGLVLNFVPEPEVAVEEMVRVAKSGGTVGIYLWDYADGMEMLRTFWDAAIALDAAAAEMDEGNRFPLCREGALETLVRGAGLKQVQSKAVEVTTRFEGFDDYWEPFLGKVGPAPSYNMSLSQKDRRRLEERLRQTLPIAADGSISLLARAWAVRGTV